MIAEATAFSPPHSVESTLVCVLPSSLRPLGLESLLDRLASADMCCLSRVSTAFKVVFSMIVTCRGFICLDASEKTCCNAS